MKKIMKIPFYVLFLGVLVSFAFFIIAANSPNTALLTAGLIIFFFSGIMLAVRFFLGACGFFGMVLDSK